MKYIFDFDDVVIDNSKKFKTYMFATIRRNGFPETKARSQYKKVRTKEFSLLNFLKSLFPAKNNRDVQKMYKDILKPAGKFLNKEILNIITKNGKKNCFIVTNGDRKFQLDKMKYCNIHRIFLKSHIFIVPGSKKKPITDICKKYPNEEIVYFDDKKKFFLDLPLKKFPNLRPVEYKKYK